MVVFTALFTDHLIVTWLSAFCDVPLHVSAVNNVGLSYVCPGVLHEQPADVSVKLKDSIHTM